jgi:hypothetical protein
MVRGPRRADETADDVLDDVDIDSLDDRLLLGGALATASVEE